MFESLPGKSSRFSILLIITNLSILTLLLFWLWRYWHSGMIVAEASNVDGFFDRQAQLLKISNEFIFEPYVFDFVFILIPSLIIFLGYGIAEETKRLAIANILFTIHSVLVLVACIFIQSKIGVVHLWTSTVLSAVCQNSLSSYFIDRKKLRTRILI